MNITKAKIRRMKKTLFVLLVSLFFSYTALSKEIIVLDEIWSHCCSSAKWSSDLSETATNLCPVLYGPFIWEHEILEVFTSDNGSLIGRVKCIDGRTDSDGFAVTEFVKKATVINCDQNPELCPIEDEPSKTSPSCGGVGNPCQVSTGSKTQAETDFSSGLGFTRFYQTLNLVDVGLGKGWRSNFQQQLSISGDNLFVVEQSGRGDPWSKVNGVWESDIDSDYILVETTTGFTVTGKRGDVMEYDLEGRLLSETDTQGKTTSYAYDSENRLITVTNHYGLSISFTYSTDGKNHIIGVTNNNNEEYRYEYDSNDNLIAVIYPDTNTDPSDNPRKIYYYENTDFPNHLTGITDAKGNRYGTYAFDENGKAISTEHAQTTNAVGQERFQLNYSTQGAN